MDFDLKDPETHTSGLAEDVFRELRAHEPVYWHDETDGPGFWCLTKYHDISAVSKDPEMFGSALELGGIFIDDSRTFEANAGVNMITSDPPKHSALRHIVSPAFSPIKVTSLEASIVQCVQDLLAALRGTDRCEFVDTVAAPLPIDILATILGAIDKDKSDLIRWSDQLVGFDDPEIRSSRTAIRDSLRRMSMYALSLWLHYSKAKNESIISMLVHGRDEKGEHLSMRDFIATFILLIVAGNETTRNAISGGLLALDQHPDEKQKLIDVPGRISTAVNEILRWVSPVIYMRRTAMNECKIRGKRIRKGDKLILWYGSANRDEEVFSDPYCFDIGSDRPANIAFGVGPHFCIGARLAKLQLTILFGELFAEFPGISIDGKVDRLRSSFINGIKRMPVALNK